MDVNFQTTLINLVLSAIVITILGVALFSWNLAVILFPFWLRVLIVGSLFTHLIIRNTQILLFQKNIKKTNEEYIKN